MKRFLLIISILLTLSLYGDAQRRPPRVSLVSLLTQPEKYNNKPVSVFGYFMLEFEHSALYLSKADAEYFVTESSLWVNCTNLTVGSSPHMYYARVEGIFKYSGRGAGHLGMFAAKIDNAVAFKLGKFDRSKDGDLSE